MRENVEQIVRGLFMLGVLIFFFGFALIGEPVAGVIMLAGMCIMVSLTVLSGLYVVFLAVCTIYKKYIKTNNK